MSGSTRKIILSSAAIPYVPYAEKKLFELETRRRSADVAVLSSSFQINGIVGLLTAARWGSKLIMWGGGADEILLQNGTEIWAYSYTKDTLEKRLGFSDGALLNPLSQSCSGRMNTKDRALTTKQGSVKAAYQEPFDASCVLPFSNSAVIRRGNTLTTQSAAEFHNLALLPANTWNDMLVVQRNIGLLASDLDQWNSLDTTELWEISPTDPGSGAVTWYWVPRIWYPDPGNGLQIPAGLYYGMAEENINVEASTEIKVEFGCVLEDRGGGGVGYCETLESTGVCYFMDRMWVPDKTFYYAHNVGSYTTKTVSHSYWDSTPEAYAKVTLNLGTDTSTLKMRWWSSYPSAVDRDRQGLIAYHPGGAYAFFRNAGAFTEIKRGTDYIDHSVSLDGRTVVIFTGSGVIAHVWVFDLDNNKVLRDSATVAGHNFATGELLTYPLLPVEGITSPIKPPIGGYESQIVPQDKGKDYRVCAFGMTFPYPEMDGFTAGGWKVEVKNGTHGRGFLWADPCWQESTWGVTNYSGGQAPEMDSIKELIFFGAGEADAHKEYGQAVFASDGSPRYDDLGEIYERKGITMQETLPDYSLEASKNAKPPYVWSGDVEPGVFPNTYRVKYKPCGEQSRVTLTDGCGISFTDGFSRPEKVPPVIAKYSQTASVGEPCCFIVDVGNGSPFTYTGAGGLTVNPTTGVITAIDSCTGPGQTKEATIVVKDQCGKPSNVLKIYLSGGHWAASGPVVETCAGNTWGDESGISSCIADSGTLYIWGTKYSYLGSDVCSSECYLNMQLSTHPCLGTSMPTACNHSGGYYAIPSILGATQQYSWVCP